MHQTLEKWNGHKMPQPTEPGIYTAQHVSLDFIGKKILSPPYRVEVVGDITNPRGQKLLVRTGLEWPKYASLDCYEWHI